MLINANQEAVTVTNKSTDVQIGALVMVWSQSSAVWQFWRKRKWLVFFMIKGGVFWLDGHFLAPSLVGTTNNEIIIRFFD